MDVCSTNYSRYIYSVTRVAKSVKFILVFFWRPKIWEFSVCGANVLGPLSGTAPYGTYFPVYAVGGEGGSSP